MTACSRSGIICLLSEIIKEFEMSMNRYNEPRDAMTKLGKVLSKKGYGYAAGYLESFVASIAYNLDLSETQLDALMHMIASCSETESITKN